MLIIDEPRWCANIFRYVLVTFGGAGHRTGAHMQRLQRQRGRKHLWHVRACGLSCPGNYDFHDPVFACALLQLPAFHIPKPHAPSSLECGAVRCVSVAWLCARARSRSMCTTYYVEQTLANKAHSPQRARTQTRDYSGVMMRMNAETPTHHRLSRWSVMCCHPKNCACVCMCVSAATWGGGGGICAMLDDYVLCVDAIIFPDSRASGRTGVVGVMCTPDCVHLLCTKHNTPTHPNPHPKPPSALLVAAYVRLTQIEYGFSLQVAVAVAIAFDTILAWNKCVCVFFVVCLAWHRPSLTLSAPSSAFPDPGFRAGYCAVTLRLRLRWMWQIICEIIMCRPAYLVCWEN